MSSDLGRGKEPVGSHSKLGPEPAPPRRRPRPLSDAPPSPENRPRGSEDLLSLLSAALPHSCLPPHPRGRAQGCPVGPPLELRLRSGQGKLEPWPRGLF